MHNHEELLRRVEELEQEVAALRKLVLGENGSYGLAVKVDVLWKIIAGVVIALCGAIGIKLQNLLSKL